MAPMILFNPNDKVVEFMYDHQSYIFQPGEKKLLDGFVADHALRFTQTGLKIYDGSIETFSKNFGEGVLAYDKMPWRKLVAMASRRGLFKPSMSKQEVLNALIEADKYEGIVDEQRA